MTTDRAGASPVDRQVRHRAWWHPQGAGTEDCAENWGPDELVSHGWEPLYDQAALNAAVAAERERIAKNWDGFIHEGMPCNMDIGASIRVGELVPWVGGA